MSRNGRREKWQRRGRKREKKRRKEVRERSVKLVKELELWGTAI